MEIWPLAKSKVSETTEHDLYAKKGVDSSVAAHSLVCKSFTDRPLKLVTVKCRDETRGVQYRW